MQEGFIKILSTKIIPDDLTQQAKSANIKIDSVNFIETKSANDISVIEKIKQFSTQTITAIFTSANSVVSVFSVIHTKPDWRIFCTSGATKEALLNFADKIEIIDTAHNASALADKILEHQHIGLCVFFCGNQRLNSLPDKLLRHGLNVEEVVVYETIASPKRLDSVYKGILFFSPSAVESFFSANEIDNTIVLFSVGKTTTKAIRKFTKNTIITAHFPSAESVVKEARRYFTPDI